MRDANTFESLPAHDRRSGKALVAKASASFRKSVGDINWNMPENAVSCGYMRFGGSQPPGQWISSANLEQFLVLGPLLHSAPDILDGYGNILASALGVLAHRGDLHGQGLLFSG